MPRITVVRGKLIEITDPAKKAALDRRFRTAIRAIEGENVTPRKNRARQTK
jgi:hypothetical protein